MENQKMFTKQVDTYIKQSNLPYVSLSYAMSADGKIATKTGDSKYISGKESLAFVHELRNMHDAILVGINTVLLDNPSLTTRFISGKRKDPIRIVLDTNLRIPLTSQILHLTSDAKTIIVTSNQADTTKIKQIETLGHQVIICKTKNGTLDLKDVLISLFNLQIKSILVEGGSLVHYSFIKENLVCSIYATIAPLIIGGTQAKGPVGGEGFATLQNSKKLSLVNSMLLGDDIVLHFTIN